MLQETILLLIAKKGNEVYNEKTTKIIKVHLYTNTKNNLNFRILNDGKSIPSFQKFNMDMIYILQSITC